MDGRKKRIGKKNPKKIGKNNPFKYRSLKHVRVPPALAGIDLVEEDLGELIQGADGVYQPKHPEKIDPAKILKDVSDHFAALSLAGELASAEGWGLEPADPNAGFAGPLAP